jgi:hypothetical protein
MNRPRIWTVLVFAQSALWLMLWSLVSIRVRLATWCHVGLAHLSYRAFISIIQITLVLIAAIALAIIIHALRNTRVSYGMRAWWATALVLGSPIITPAYWAIHLRRT